MKQNTELIKRAVREFYETHGADFSATRRGALDVMRLIQERLAVGIMTAADSASPSHACTQTLIDVGAGNARLAREIPEDVRYIAIEPSSSMRVDAERFLSRRPDSEVRMGGFPHLPARDAEADVVACLAVIHHLAPEERAAAVHELWRIVKPGGALVLTVWNLRSRRFFKVRTWLASWLRMRLVAHGGVGDVWIPWNAGGATVQRYVHCFTQRELRRLFVHSEWSIERCEPWGGGGPTSILDGRNIVVVARKRSGDLSV